MLLIPTMSYSWSRISSMNRSSVGKSSNMQGAWRLTWISISPQERWNIRKENGPWTRVTWLCHSSIGFSSRLPYSSSWA